MKLKSELNKIKNFIIKITGKKNNLYNHLTFTSKSSCKNKILKIKIYEELLSHKDLGYNSFQSDGSWFYYDLSVTFGLSP